MSLAPGSHGWHVFDRTPGDSTVQHHPRVWGAARVHPAFGLVRLDIEAEGRWSVWARRQKRGAWSMLHHGLRATGEPSVAEVMALRLSWVRGAPAPTPGQQ